MGCWMALGLGILLLVGDVASQSTTELIRVRSAQRRASPGGQEAEAVPVEQVVEYGSPPPAPYAKEVNLFGLGLLREVRRREKDVGNVVFSPLSLAAAFSLLHFGAAGESKEELEAVFGFERSGVAKSILKNARTAAQANNGTVIVNRVYVQEGVKVLQSYIRAIGANRIGLVNFLEDAEAARKEINSFASEVTQGLIADALPRGSVDATTVFVLLNVVFFKGTWKDKFEKEHTIKGKFVGVKGEQETDFMGNKKIEVLWRSVPELNSQAIELPYEGEAFSMFIVLPDTVNGYKAAEDNLHRVMEEGLLFHGAQKKTFGTFSIPKFELDGELEDLAKILKALGLKSIFSNPDLSGISNQHLPLSSIIHKAKVIINEEGTSAAAVTAATYQKSANTDAFVADHPFLFFIVEKSSGLVWFQGTVTHF